MTDAAREVFDVAIIGGGPAGSVAAILLARLGWRTILIERRPRGQGKTCGHCLSTRAIPMLASIGLDKIIHEVAAGETKVMLAHTPPPAASRMARSAQPIAAPAPSILTPRDRLDHRLIDEARSSGVMIRQPATIRIDEVCSANCRMSTLTIRNPHSEERRVQARLVIGADGLGSQTARRFGLTENNGPGRKFGFSVRIEGPEVPQHEHLRAGAIQMFITPHGYLGMVRERDGSLHCAALVQPPINRARHDPASFISTICNAFPQLNAQLTQSHHSGLAPSLSHSLQRQIIAAGPMPWRAARVAAPGVALVGDAAAYVEPFTGEGMTWAIESAILLAEVCERVAPGAWSQREAEQYAVLYRDRIRRRQRLCRAISLGLERPWLWRRALRRNVVSSFITRRVAARLHTAGEA